MEIMEIILKNCHRRPFLKFRRDVGESCISLEEKLGVWVTFLNGKEKLLQLYKWPCEHYLSQPAMKNRKELKMLKNPCSAHTVACPAVTAYSCHLLDFSQNVHTRSLILRMTMPGNKTHAYYWKGKKILSFVAFHLFLLFVLPNRHWFSFSVSRTFTLNDKKERSPGGGGWWGLVGWFWVLFSSFFSCKHKTDL